MGKIMPPQIVSSTNIKKLFMIRPLHRQFRVICKLVEKIPVSCSSVDRVTNGVL